MELVEHRCPNCQASIKIDLGAQEVTCEFCRHTFRLREEGRAPRPSPVPAGGKSARSGRKILILVLVIVGLVLAATVGTCVCVAGMFRTAVSTAGKLAQVKVKGTLTSKGGELGDFTVRLTSCQAGEPHGFFGVDVFTGGDDRSRLRFLRDPTRGNLVVVAVPGTQRGLVFDSGKCKVLEGEIKRRGYGGGRTVYWAFDGKLRFDCTYSGGAGHVVGSMTFHDCL